MESNKKKIIKNLKKKINKFYSLIKWFFQIWTKIIIWIKIIKMKLKNNSLKKKKNSLKIKRI